MQNSPGGKKMRNSFYAGGCKTTRFEYTTPEAGWDTVPYPWQWGSTAFPVGGFMGIAINNGDGTVTFRIGNVSGTYSFFGHAVSDRSSAFGPMSNIIQIIEWTEQINSNACGGPKPAAHDGRGIGRGRRGWDKVVETIEGQSSEKMQLRGDNLC